MSALKDPGGLLPHPLNRSADRGLGRARGLQLGHELARPLHIRVDRKTVVAAPDDREIDIGGNRDRIVRERRKRGGDLLKDRVLVGS